MEPRASELYKNILAWAKKRGWKERTRTKERYSKVFDNRMIAAGVSPR
jgi:hypothetical protein